MALARGPRATSVATIPTYLDRYPAKMVSRLARRIVARYARPPGVLLDPFCGSGAILLAGVQQGLRVIGTDINPYAVLLSQVKLEGFDRQRAAEVMSDLTERLELSGVSLPMKLEGKSYWFTEGTLRKLERLRYVAQRANLSATREGRAVLLAVVLSVRRCSKADQRSPKPFISKLAISKRKGKHFDPAREARLVFDGLTALYAGRGWRGVSVRRADVTHGKVHVPGATASVVITSPPYINAQDYYRNVKLELALLEDILPFNSEEIRERFVGTERGDLMASVRRTDIVRHKDMFPAIKKIEVTHPRSAAVIHRYLADMWRAFSAIRCVLRRGGKLVVVCGDNLVAGYSVPTWKILNAMASGQGFVLFDRFGDRIDRRMLAPKRNGHKGLIKQEVVSAFRLA